MQKKPVEDKIEPEITDVEPDEEGGELEVVEQIAPIKGLTKLGRPRKQMSDEVKARNAEVLKIAREKARLLKKAQSAVTAKQRADAKEKKDAENDAKKKAKEDLKKLQDEQIQEYEKQEHDAKVNKIEEVKTLPTKKKKKAVVVVEQDESDSDIEEIVVKTRKTKKQPPAPTPAVPPPPPPRVPPVPVPAVYSQEEVAKLKAQKLAFEKQQKKNNLLMAAIFN